MRGFVGFLAGLLVITACCWLGVQIGIAMDSIAVAYAAPYPIMAAVAGGLFWAFDR